MTRSSHSFAATRSARLAVVWFVWMIGCDTSAAIDAGSVGTDGGTRRDAGARADAGPPPDTGTGIPRPSMDVADPNLSVVPWNGRVGAVSFTFDDAYGSALDAVLPALDERDLPGTFFVICDAAAGRESDWREVATSGVHEVANHTQSHAGASSGSEAEVTDCHAYIRDVLGVEPTTFAYPLVDVGDPYQAYARDHYVAARGSGDEVVNVDDVLDWTDLPSWFTGPGGGVGTARQGILDAIDEARSARAWTILTAHSVELDDYYARISLADLEAMLDRAIEDELWIDTFGRVAAYLRGQQIFEAITPVASANRLEWTWTPPPGTPEGTILRVVIDGGTLSQRGVSLAWNATDGYYPVDVAAGALVWDR